MVKFTFKLDKKETGLAAVGNSLQSADVKLKKKVCGRIQAPNWRSNVYRCSFVVKTEESSCGWKWVTLKKTTESMNEMKQWLKDNTEKIVSGLDLHFFED